MSPTESIPVSNAAPDAEAPIDTDVVVLGAGPGGYTAAFRAADLGKRVVLVERYETLGGVCLNVGCIPSKTLLHMAAAVEEARALDRHGISFGEPTFDLTKIRGFVAEVVNRMTRGLDALAAQRKVRVVRGEGELTSDKTLEVRGSRGITPISFEHAIIAAGSRVIVPPIFSIDDPRLMDSTDALLLREIPKRMLVIGGGVIGLELATVYHALGSRVTVVELLDGLMPECDRDLVRPLHKRISGSYENVYVSTRVTAVEPLEEGLRVTFEGAKAPASDVFDRVLLAVGRRPNGDRVGAQKAGIQVDEHGFIPVDDQLRTNVEHIFAIGDIVGQPMLAHKASHEGKVAAEVISGLKSGMDGRVIPSVAYTDPEVAWVGLTEKQAKATGVSYRKGVFPWSASGRNQSIGRTTGSTKLIFDDTGRIVGAGIVGPHAGELIAEATHAIEMGSDALDIALTIHPHPTLSETLGMAAEAFEGTVTDLFPT